MYTMIQQQSLEISIVDVLKMNKTIQSSPPPPPAYFGIRLSLARGGENLEDRTYLAWGF